MLSPESQPFFRRKPMPRAVALPIREQIIALHQQGMPLTTIAQQLGRSYHTVRQCWQRFAHEGVAGLSPHYAQCGSKQPRFSAAVQEAALTLKREHPRWGAGLIRVELEQQFPNTALPSNRSLQRWFVVAGLQPLRSKRPAVVSSRARGVHEVWELDAKERMRLADRTGTSVLTVTDEASGAWLGALVFPPVSLGAGSRDAGTRGDAFPVCALGASPVPPRG
jgi:transposase